MKYHLQNDDFFWCVILSTKGGNSLVERSRVFMASLTFSTWDHSSRSVFNDAPVH